MGKKSIRKNKNIYQLSREELGLTREKAGELLEIISADRIEKIESEKSLPHPDEILTMSKCYKKPELCNYYCSHECPIGQEHVPEVKMKELSQIVLETLASLNSINKEKERFIDIAADGSISENEYKDFVAIQDKLEKISLAADSLKLWVQTTIVQNGIDESKLDAIRKELQENE